MWVFFCSEHQEVWGLGHEICIIQVLIDSIKLPFKVLCQYTLIYSCEWESHLSIHLPILALSYFNLQTWWVRYGIWFLFYFSFPWLLMELSLFLLFFGCSDSSFGNALFIAFGHFSLRLFIFFIVFCGNLAYSVFPPPQVLGQREKQYWNLLEIPVQCYEPELHSFLRISFPKLKRGKPQKRGKEIPGVNTNCCTFQCLWTSTLSLDILLTNQRRALI